jgi:26S proteasome regulatory subunit N6
LTACRTAANAIYVVPLLQAEIDEMSGILHCEEGDYTTAYSYFLEAFDAYDQNNQKKSAISCLKYMMLSKILNEASHEVPSLLSTKMAVKHVGRDLNAMAAIAASAKVKSLEDFQTAVRLSFSC